MRWCLFCTKYGCKLRCKLEHLRSARRTNFWIPTFNVIRFVSLFFDIIRIFILIKDWSTHANVWYHTSNLIVVNWRCLIAHFISPIILFVILEIVIFLEYKLCVGGFEIDFINREYYTTLYIQRNILAKLLNLYMHPLIKKELIFIDLILASTRVI